MFQVAMANWEHYKNKNQNQNQNQKFKRNSPQIRQRGLDQQIIPPFQENYADEDDG